MKWGAMVRRNGRSVLAICAAAVLISAGCDFFKSSGPEGGVSPFITNLRLSHSSTPCDRDFLISFEYQDAQNDIEFMRVNFRHEDGFTYELEVLFQTGGGLVPEENPDPDEDLEEDIFGGSLDLSVPGSAAYTYHFQCGTALPTGSYLITVQLVDDNGHESNTRSDSISLTSS